MYTIYADGKLLYAPHLFREGCGVLSPRLTVELDKAGSLEFTMPPNNIQYDYVQKLKTIITAYQNTNEIFRGRILHDEKDFYKQKKTYCEGELAFLLDSAQRPYIFEGTYEELFRKIISNHNSRVEANKRFTVGTVSVEKSGETVKVSSMDYPNTSDEIQDKLLNAIGGHLKIRSSGDIRYIDWIAESGGLCNQVIEFGVNLLDINEYITAEDIYTVLIPLGASINDSSGNAVGKITIATVNDGKDYIEDASAIALFGRIEKTMEWSDIELPEALKKLGTDALSKNIELAVTLDVRAVDLHLLNVDVDDIRVGDWVRVVSIPHGLDRQFQCRKITYNFTDPDQNEYVFGVNFTSLTEQQKNIGGSMSMVMSSVSSSASRTTQLETRVYALEQGGGGGGGSGEPGKDGVTFTPSVSTAGIISWTNDGELDNPDPVDIKGPAGPAGPSGSTPTKGVDYWTTEDKAEIVDNVLASLPVYNGEVS